LGWPQQSRHGLPVNQDGSGYSVLHNFEGSWSQNSNDGLNPQGPLALGADGFLYGTTSGGGTNQAQNSQTGGTVFRLDADGTGFTLLHSFPDGTNDGTSPQAGLLLGMDRMLYGTATAGGTANAGVIFRLNPNGIGYTVLHNFANIPLLPVAQSALVQGTDGLLYGTTIQSQAGPGAIFRLKPDGQEYTVLHVFGGFVGDGLGPQGPPFLSADGSLYGTTASGGVRGIGFGGTVFRVTTSPVSPFATTIHRSAQNSFNISFKGIVGAPYRVDTSTNLTDWWTLGTVLNNTGLVQFLDESATNAPQRFYRAVLLP
jgi:uncharacterized repeat protein (TIGR03803 family)